MYATSQDMLDRYGQPRLVQLTDVNLPLTGEIVDAVLHARLADASAEIDGYLAGRMPVPVASAPPVLRVLACRIAYVLLMRDNASEADREDLAAARAYLRDIATGKVGLLPPGAIDESASIGAGSILFNAGDKVMGRESA